LVQSGDGGRAGREGQVTARVASGLPLQRGVCRSIPGSCRGFPPLLLSWYRTPTPCSSCKRKGCIHPHPKLCWGSPVSWEARGCTPSRADPPSRSWVPRRSPSSSPRPGWRLPTIRRGGPGWLAPLGAGWGAQQRLGDAGGRTGFAVWCANKRKVSLPRGCRASASLPQKPEKHKKKKQRGAGRKEIRKAKSPAKSSSCGVDRGGKGVRLVPPCPGAWQRRGVCSLALWSPRHWEQTTPGRGFSGSSRGGDTSAGFLPRSEFPSSLGMGETGSKARPCFTAGIRNVMGCCRSPAVLGGGKGGEGWGKGVLRAG